MLTEVKYPQQILINVPSTKFHKNPSRKRRFLPGDRTDGRRRDLSRL